MTELEKFLKDPEGYVKRELKRLERRRMNMLQDYEERIFEIREDFQRRLIEHDEDTAMRIEEWRQLAKENGIELPVLDDEKQTA